MSDPAIDYFNKNASALADQYNALDREKVHADLLTFLPAGQTLRVLDIGAGSGADAAMFAAKGHDVVAAEPADALRTLGQKSFFTSEIKWNADVLPDLVATRAAGQMFDVVTLVGVLQYLDKPGRTKSLKNIFSLVAQNGFVEIQYPTPASREHQHSIPSAELGDFLNMFNKAAAADSQMSVVFDKVIPDFSGRKALDGSDLFFRTVILRRAGGA